MENFLPEPRCIVNLTSLSTGMGLPQPEELKVIVDSGPKRNHRR
jgi:hypothetical protein